MGRFFNRNKKKRPLLNKKNIKKFLKEISKSVDQNFSGQESAQLQIVLRGELNNWLQNTIQKGEPLDVTSVKVGICLGILESLRKINESEQLEEIPYIA